MGWKPVKDTWSHCPASVQNGSQKRYPFWVQAIFVLVPYLVPSLVPDPVPDLVQDLLPDLVKIW